MNEEIKTLPSVYQSIIHLSRYSRYQDSLKRRETWVETVDRYINYMYQQCKKQKTSKEDLHEIYIILGATCEE
jgi:ribonucleoside-diphosphate reductase alpha chain